MQRLVLESELGLHQNSFLVVLNVSPYLTDEKNILCCFVRQWDKIGKLINFHWCTLFAKRGDLINLSREKRDKECVRACVLA